MTEITHLNAPTRFVDVGDVRYAYRRFGPTGSTPLVFLQHFTGNIDNWDPAVVDGLARHREVVLFDNVGVASSTGTPAKTVDDMARGAAAFVDALGLKRFDLLGFSIGGMIAQQFVLDRPELVRRLVLVGTGPRGGEGLTTFTPEVWEMFGRTYAVPDEIWLEGFFTPSPTSQTAGRAFLDRLRERVADRDVPVSPAVVEGQLAAVAAWGVQAEGSYDYLKSIAQPTLVVNGSNDIIIPTVNSFILAQNLPDAQLILYPDSNHGSQYHDPARFVGHVEMFLA